MSRVDVTIINPVFTDERKIELALRLTNALVSIAGAYSGPQRWRVVAEAVRPANGAGRARAVAGQRPADLDYAAWRAHLGGTRRWAPGGETA